MAGMLVILIFYQGLMLIPRNGEDKLRYHINLPDICFILILVLFGFRILTDGQFELYKNAKIITAFMMYVLGRMAYKRASESTVYLAVSSYCVIYINVIIAIINLGISGFFAGQPDNGMYYYGTDLAYAMLVGLIFIGMYGKNNILKFFTIFIVCPFMILHSLAKVQHIILWIVYVVLFLFMSERAVKRRKFTDLILPFMIIIMFVIIIILNIPAITGNNTNILVELFNKLKISTQNFVDRYAGWGSIWDEIMDSNSLTRKLFGLGNASDRSVSSLYIGIIYSIGYVGFLLFFIFSMSIAGCAAKIYDRRTYYVTVMLAVLFLGTGINVFAIGFTQMSWFPLLYAGMVVSAANSADK